MEMRTPHTGRTTAPRSGGVHPWETGSVTPPSPHRHTHTHIHESPTFPLGSVQPCLRRAWGHQPGTEEASKGGQPPWASSGSETAQSCPRDENGKGGHLARPVSCGVSPVQSPGWGQGHSPPSQPQKAWVSLTKGALRGRCPGARAPAPNGFPLRLKGDGVQGGPSSWQLKARGEGGPWAGGAKQAQASQIDARVPENALQTGRGGMRRTGKHLVTPTATPCSKNEYGPLPPGAPPRPPPPSLVPKYFPPSLSLSQSSWDRKIPRAAGPALSAATARPPSLSLTLCLMGPDSPQRLSGEGPRASRQPGLPSQGPPDHQPPAPDPHPNTETITTLTTRRAALRGWHQGGGRPGTVKWVSPAAHPGLGEGGGLRKG